MNRTLFSIRLGLLAMAETCAYPQASYRTAVLEFVAVLEGGGIHKMSAPAQRGGDPYRFYVSPDKHPGYLIRTGVGDASLHGLEHWVEGAWASAPPSVMAAIFGLGDDLWSGPSWYADPLTPEEARRYAAEHGIDLFADHADP